MNKFIVGLPWVSCWDNFKSRIDQIYENYVFTNNGKYVQELEEEIGHVLNVKNVVCVSSGTIALQIAALALEKEFPVVYVPAFTFPATAFAFYNLGYDVVLVDVNRETHLMDCEDLRRKIRPKEEGIIVPVNLWGQQCLVENFGMDVIYDCAHSFNAFKNEGISVYSFHATKIFNTFEGGCITTDDDSLAIRIRRIRNFGFEDERIRIPGVNGKMSEIHACIGLTNLRDVECFQLHAELLREEYKKLSCIKVLDTQNNYCVIETEYRDELLEELGKHGIIARKYFYPGIHRLPGFNMRKWSVPNTEEICGKVLCLPVTQYMDTLDVRFVCGVISELYNRRR